MCLALFKLALAPSHLHLAEWVFPQAAMINYLATTLECLLMISISMCIFILKLSISLDMYKQIGETYSKVVKLKAEN